MISLTISHKFFSAEADPELENYLTATFEHMRSDIQNLRCSKYISSVVLGGSYGRGEGGCVKDHDGKSRPYNDLDFFVFTCGAMKKERKVIDEALAEIGATYSQRLGIDVDFAPARNVHTLKSVSNTLMFQELRRGYTILFGTDLFVRKLPLLPFEQLPPAETLRLMLNRGIGLLLALQKSISKTGEEQFILRNYAKAILGCGDALLLAGNRYLPKAGERRAIMRAWAAASDAPKRLKTFYPIYNDMVKFKNRPETELSTPLEPELLIQTIHDYLNILVFIVSHYSNKMLETPQACLSEFAENPIFKSGFSLKNGIFSLLYFRNDTTHAGIFSSPRLKIFEKLISFFVTLDQKGIKEAEKIFSSPDFSSMLEKWKRFN